MASTDETSPKKAVVSSQLLDKASFGGKISASSPSPVEFILTHCRCMSDVRGGSWMGMEEPS